MPAHQPSTTFFRAPSKALGASVCLALTLTVALAQANDGNKTPLKQMVRIACGSIIDGVSEHRLAARTLTIQDWVLLSISEISPEAAVDFDLSDYTCLPGLINTHVHLDTDLEDATDYGVYARRTQAENLALILTNASTTVHTGFTTV